MSKAADLANLIGNINAGGGGVGRNLIINGMFNVFQRATSVNGGSISSFVRLADRFWLYGPSTSSGSIGQSTDVPSGERFVYSLYNNTDASVNIGSNVELLKTGSDAPFVNGKEYTLSFYVKGNASTGNAVTFTSRDDAGGTGSVSRATVPTFDITSSWNRVSMTFTLTGTVGGSNKCMQFEFGLPVGAYVTGFQLEVGQNATEFEHEPFATTLLKCQRYFHAVSGAGHPFPIDSAYARYITHSQDSNGTKWYYEYPVEMRAIPTLELNNISSSTVQHYNYNASASYNMTGTSLAESGTRHAHISFTFASGISTGNTVSWRWLNNPNASWNFKAEI
jgi:hypothetical protein